MAVRKILTQENDALHKVCKPVKDFDKGLWELLGDMKETLLKAKGVGLSACQVGVLKRVFIVLLDNCYLEMINPKIVRESGSQTGEEGCLSIPGRYEYVTRPKEVTVSFVDRFNNPMTLSVTNFMSRIICHETDHLNGILYIDLLKKNKSKDK